MQALHVLQQQQQQQQQSSSSSERASSTDWAAAGARVLSFARKRSKASLLSLGGGGGGGEPFLSDSGGPPAPVGSSDEQQQHQPRAPLPPPGAPPAMMAAAAELRARTPGGFGGLGGGGGGAARGAGAAGATAGGVALDAACNYALLAGAFVALAATETATPRDAYIARADLAHYGQPLLGNTVPGWAVPLYALLLPLLLFALQAAVCRRPLLEARQLSLGLVAAVLLTGLSTNLCKVAVARPRPNFNARCWPSGAAPVLAGGDEFGGFARCAAGASAPAVAEGRKSFPSGHSSWSAAGMVYLTLLLLDRLAVFAGSGGGGGGAGHPWRLAAALAPSVAAVAVGVTRVVDGWHHPTDVLAGLVLGGALAALFYAQQRPRLAELDPATYGGGGIGSGGGGGGGGGGGAGGAARLAVAEEEDDGQPLLLGGASAV